MDLIATGDLVLNLGLYTFLLPFLTQKSVLPAVYAQASMFLKYSQGEYEMLRQFISDQLEGYRMAKSYLTLK